MDCSPPGFSVHGIYLARILGWVATPFSKGSSWTRDQTLHWRQSLYHLSYQSPFFLWFSYFSFSGGTSGKESTCQCRWCLRDAGSILGSRDPLEKVMATHSSSLAGKFHGQRSLAGYSPWGCKELDTTEHALAHTHTHTHTGKLHTSALKTSSSQQKSIFLLGMEISKYRQCVWFYLLDTGITVKASEFHQTVPSLKVSLF